jgi:hypothetical protein
MDSSKKNAPGQGGIPQKPVFRGHESTAAVQIKMQSYFNRLRLFWRKNGIGVNSTGTESQLERLVAILKLHGNHGLGSIEARIAGGMLQAPARIQDLEEKGYELLSVPEDAWGADGLFHKRCARYFLIAEPKVAA